MSLFHGLSAFPITPARDGGHADAPALHRLLARLTAAKVDSIGLLGSTGGYAYLDLGERQAVLETALESIAGAAPVIVGVGALRTKDAVTLAAHAQAAGAAGLLLAPISYTPLTEDEVFQHFAAIARSSDLPICVYDNPSTTHFSVSPHLLVRLATLPTVKAAKLPLPEDGDVAAQIARLRPQLPDGFSLGFSGDWGARAALLAGADAFYSVAAGLLPRPVMGLARAAMAGDAEEAARQDAGLAPLWDLFRQFGSLRVMFMAAQLLSLTEAAPPRPILPLPDSERGRLAHALRVAGAM